MAEALVTSHRRLGQDLHLLGFRPAPDHLSGDNVEVTVEGNTARRLYSLYSSPFEDEAILFFRLIDQGALTPLLAQLEKGDRIEVIRVVPGLDLPIDGVSSLVFLSTGTGLAPFRSAVAGGVFPKMWLHGCQYLSEVPVELRSNPHGPVVCTSRASDGDFAGRITEYLDSHPLPSPAKFYLCGSAMMIADVSRLLLDRGVAESEVQFEVFS